MLLEVSALSVHYETKEALRGISLQVEENAVVCILGPNGAGKSTLLKAVTGLKSPTRGEIIFKGSHIEGMSADRIVRRGLALSPEGRRIFPYMSVRDNLLLGAFSRSDRESVPDDLERMFTYFPILKEKLAQKAGTLSGGQQQMLAIGRSLMAKPTLLALDEPSLGLAPLVIAEIGRALLRLRDEGLSILLVEQNTRLGLSIASKVYVLENGNVVLTGKPSDVGNDEHLRMAYLGKPSVRGTSRAG